MSTVLPTQLTADDLLTMPDGDRYELIDGELKELHMSQESTWVSGEIHFRLRLIVGETGVRWAFPEGASYQIFPWDPGRTRQAVVSFIRRERLPEGPTGQGHTKIVPDLVVEVVSLNDSLYDVEEKVNDYLEAGVPIVWVANPRLRTITIYRLSDPAAPRRLREPDELCGEDALEGFHCRVGDLFPPHGPEPNVARSGDPLPGEST